MRRPPAGPLCILECLVAVLSSAGCGERASSQLNSDPIVLEIDASNITDVRRIDSSALKDASFLRFEFDDRAMSILQNVAASNPTRQIRLMCKEEHITSMAVGTGAGVTPIDSLPFETAAEAVRLCERLQLLGAKINPQRCQ